MKDLLAKWNRISLVKQIILGLAVGIVLAVTVPDKFVFSDLSHAISEIVRFVIKFDPLGVMGLVFNAIC